MQRKWDPAPGEMMFTEKTHSSPSLGLSYAFWPVSPLCCRGFPASTAPDAGSAGESSPGPHQHFCLYCAAATRAMSITSAAWSTWNLPSNTSSHPSAEESQCWCLAASEVLPLLFNLDEGGNLHHLQTQNLHFHKYLWKEPCFSRPFVSRL